MENHAGVLQQRVQISALVSSRKQVTGEKHEERQTDGNQTHDADNASHHVLRQTTRTDGNG